MKKMVSRWICSAAAGALAAVSATTAQAQIYTSIAQLSGAIDPNTTAEEMRDAPAADDVKDPFEGFNRKMFAAHLFVDDAFFVPAAKGYRAVTPKSGRRGIRRFLANFRTPGIFVNDILQGEFKRAGETLSRFVVNSTLGAGGFADPASMIGIPAHTEDFGQTLAVWGVPSGPYTFFPLVGPGTTRSNIGTLGQIGLNPLVYVRTPPANVARFTQAGVAGVSVREPLIEPLQEIRESSLDYYASFRSFYLQSRQREIANGRTNFEDLPDIGDFDEFDEIE
ncbi:MAG: VacJ family lipoprotein [Pseudomonadota bacterium]